MKSIIKYQAIDGKVFEDKTECEEYEHSLLTKAIKDKIIFFDEDFTELNGEIISRLRESAYIYISPDLEDAADIADTIHHEFGYIIPARSGYWYYDYDKWISINERINALARWKTILNMLENKIKEKKERKNALVEK